MTTLNKEALLQHLLGVGVPVPQEYVHECLQQMVTESGGDPHEMDTADEYMLWEPPQDDPNSVNLYHYIFEQALSLFEPDKDPDIRRQLGIYKELLDHAVVFVREGGGESGDLVFEHFMRLHGGKDIMTAEGLRELFMHHEVKEVQQVVKKKRADGSQYHERRVTLQPKLSITNKPIMRPLD
jgi:hypothetical protein